MENPFKQRVETAMHLLEVNRLKLSFFIIVVVASLLSFALGYMAAKDSTRTPIIIESR